MVLRLLNIACYLGNNCAYVRGSSINHVYLLFVSYTPISDPEAKGYFDLLIKVWQYEGSLIFMCISLLLVLFLAKNWLCYDWSVFFDLLWFCCVNCLLQVYPDGKMSQHFASLKPGDVLEVKGYNFLTFSIYLLRLLIVLYFIWCLTISTFCFL